MLDRRGCHSIEALWFLSEQKRKKVATMVIHGCIPRT